MKDNLLGILTDDREVNGALVGSVEYCGAVISLHVDPDGGPLEQCLALTRSIVAVLREIEELAKNAASKELLDSYNDNWREYQKADASGAVVDVSNPELSSEEFKSRISLRSVSVTGDELASLGYDDGGLFAGHSIIVTSSNGLVFTDAHVQLFG